MNIEQLMISAKNNGGPVQLRNGNKAYVVTDMRQEADRLGATFDSKNRFIFLVMSTQRGGMLLSFEVASDGRYTTRGESTFDVVGLFLAFANWSALRPEVQYLAMDHTGRWKGFRERPEARPNHGYWSDQNPQFGVSGIVGLPELHPDQWQHSLIERPIEASND